MGKIYAIIHFDLNSKRSAIKFDTKHVTSHSNPYGNCKNEENTSKKLKKNIIIRLECVAKNSATILQEIFNAQEVKNNIGGRVFLTEQVNSVTND